MTGGCRKVAARIRKEIPIEKSDQQKESARRNANSHFAAWEERTALVKQQAAAHSAAADAKTIRLRALRLAKEEEDRKAAALAPPPKSPKPAKKRS